MRRFLLLTVTLIGIFMLEAHADAEGYRDGFEVGKKAGKNAIDAEVFRRGWAAAMGTAQAAQDARIHDLAEQVMPGRFDPATPTYESGTAEAPTGVDL